MIWACIASSYDDLTKTITDQECVQCNMYIEPLVHRLTVYHVYVGKFGDRYLFHTQVSTMRNYCIGDVGRFI